MKIKRRTRITIERCSMTTVRRDGLQPEASVCPVCGSLTTVLSPGRAGAMLALPAADIAAALMAGEIHAAGEDGLCASSFIRRFMPADGQFRPTDQDLPN